MTNESFYYQSQDSFLVAVDCIIFGFHNNEIKLLVHHRAMEPEQGGLSLMGGFVRKDESVDQAASNILSNLTGLENIFMDQFNVYGEHHLTRQREQSCCVSDNSSGGRKLYRQRYGRSGWDNQRNK